MRPITALLLLPLATAAMDTSPPNSAANPLRIWQTSPGVNYNDSFLIGNGRLGFSLPGSALSETIVLNEDSFWSGGRMDRVNPDAAAHMSELQALIAQGKIVEAHRLAEMAYAGTPASVRHFDWLGTLSLAMTGGSGQPGGYERWLDVGDGTAGVYYTLNGTAFKREYLASHPDGVIAVRLVADKPGAVSFRVSQSRGESLNRFLDFAAATDGDTVLMGGGSMGADAIVFASGAKVVADGGTVKTVGETIVVQGADSATLYWSAWTTFRKGRDELRGAVVADLRAAAGRGYDAIRTEHVKDYQALAGRVELDLGASTTQQRAMTTAQRLTGMRTAFDPETAVLYFQFARYLLISSGRPGTLPANLQGLWNVDMSPIWGSKYTININLEMNYWPALLTNMPELHDSMLQHIKLLHSNGKDVARRMYNASGAVCHHNTDLWGDCAPQDNWVSSTYWPTGLAWMVTHVYDHYLYTRDEAVLEEFYPALRDAAVFFLDFLTEHDGHLVTNPSLSPEIQYYLPNTTQKVALTLGPTCDNSIIWEVFGMVLEANKILKTPGSVDLESRIKAARARLPPLRTDQHGGIAEFIRDYDVDEPGHRHFSHLWGLFPGSQITSSNGSVFAAAKRSLARRLDNGGGDTGWSRAWAVGLAARLLDADEAGRSYSRLLTELTYPNSMLDKNPPSAFQLDGNYGGVTLVEAIVQSHEMVRADEGGNGLKAVWVGDSDGGEGAQHLVRLLPALPKVWAGNGGGGARGLLARGGFEVDVRWDGEARLVNATLASLKGRSVWVTVGGGVVGDGNGTGTGEVVVDGVGRGVFVKLDSEVGKKYVVTLG